MTPQLHKVAPRESRGTLGKRRVDRVFGDPAQSAWKGIDETSPHERLLADPSESGQKIGPMRENASLLRKL